MILITGGLGFIGSSVAYKLLKSEDIIIIDNLSNSSLDTLYKLKKNTKKRIFFFKISLNNFYELESIFKQFKISAILHFAGFKSVFDSLKYPAKYYYNNVVGSKNLFDLAIKYNIENIIFSSSATVYGKTKRLPALESDPLHALNPYGQNKIDIENYLLKIKKNISIKILRYFNPVGADNSNITGEIPLGIPNNLMPYILKVANKEFSHLSIYGFDYKTKDGTGMRDYIHISDLVDGHIQALNLKKTGVSILNLGSGRAFSVLELVDCFEKTNKISVPTKLESRRDGDTDIIYASIDEAKKVLNFKPKLNIEDMCRDAWRFYQQYLSRK